VTRGRVKAGSTVLNRVTEGTSFSRGEVGRVGLTPRDETAASVVIDTEKCRQMQITGSSEAQFAAKIFYGLAAELAWSPSGLRVSEAPPSNGDGGGVCPRPAGR
jgi:hypothetical protein